MQSKQSTPASYITCNLVVLTVLALAGLSYLGAIHHVANRLHRIMEAHFVEHKTLSTL